MRRSHVFAALVVTIVLLITPASVLSQSSHPGQAPTGQQQLTSFAFGMAVNNDNDPARALDLLTGASFGWVRVQVRWSDVEPAGPGQINWSSIDSIVNLAQARGVNLLFTVLGAPAWAVGPGCGPIADCQFLANFMGQLAARHRGRVRAYEVWNEQNLAREWGGTVDSSQAAVYVRMLSASFQAIKAADPGAIVVSGGLTPTGVGPPIALDDVFYMQLMYEAGLGQWSDVIGVHANITNNPPDDFVDICTRNCDRGFKGHPSFYFLRFTQIQDVKAAFGDARKPIWFTEFGWPSIENVMPAPVPGFEFAADNTEIDQAQYLTRAFEMVRTTFTYVQAGFVWNLNFNLGPNEEVTAWSVLRPDFSQRPAYLALAGMATGAPPPLPAEADYDIANGHFFTQTNGLGGVGGTGYSVTDNDGIPFWTVFQAFTLENVGYPTSRRFFYKGFLSQAMQKMVFQWQPGPGRVFFINIYDEMSLAGFDGFLLVHRQTPPPFDTSPDTGLPFDQVIARHLAFLDVDPAIRERYFAEPNFLDRFGLPMSFGDFDILFAVRTQRAVLQRWKVDVPWARAGEITISNGGDIAKEVGLFPPGALVPEPPAR